MADREIAVLAYSGGLDTSVCIKWLMEEKNLDVIAVVGEVGQEHDGLEAVKQKALATGAIECYVVDMREEFANEYLAKEIMANGCFPPCRVRSFRSTSSTSRTSTARRRSPTAAPARATTRCVSRRLS